MIYLASGSPRRREILSSAGIRFTVISADADETIAQSTPPQLAVKELALRKLYAVRDSVTSEDVIITADTVVCLNGKILGKPHDRGDAQRMLSSLSGVSHQVYTGFAVCQGSRIISDFDVTQVVMRTISDDEILQYVATGECDDKAGAYAIQGMGGVFVERIDGSYQNVVGLPLCKVYSALKELLGEDTLLWQSI